MDVLDNELDKEWAMNEPRIRNVHGQNGNRIINSSLGKVGTFNEYEGSEYKDAIDYKFQSETRIRQDNGRGPLFI